MRRDYVGSCRCSFARSPPISREIGDRLFFRQLHLLRLRSTRRKKLPVTNPVDQLFNPFRVDPERNSILPRVCTLGFSIRPFQGRQRRSRLTLMATAKTLRQESERHPKGSTASITIDLWPARSRPHHCGRHLNATPKGRRRRSRLTCMVTATPLRESSQRHPEGVEQKSPGCKPRERRIGQSINPERVEQPPCRGHRLPGALVIRLPVPRSQTQPGALYRNV